MTFCQKCVSSFPAGLCVYSFLLIMNIYHSGLKVMFLSFVDVSDTELNIDLFIQQIIVYIKRIKHILESIHCFDLSTFDMHTTNYSVKLKVESVMRKVKINSKEFRRGTDYF